MSVRRAIKTIIVLLVIICVFIHNGEFREPKAVFGQEIVTNTAIFLPYIQNGNPTFRTESKFFGIYMDQYWTDQNVSSQLPQADTFAEKKHSVVGWFITLHDIAFTDQQTDMRTNNFYRQLEALWKSGYTSFVNINISVSQQGRWETGQNCPFNVNADQIAKGYCDRAIRRMAQLYKQWISTGGGRIAFLAPLPEMNGVNADGSVWTSYGGDAVNFKLAYQRFRNIFSQEGVTEDQLWWTFAPNGWSKEGHEFEAYYPGSSIVDVIGFSSYNYGHCQVAIPWQRWENYDTLFTPYLDRIQAMDSTKPIIIAQSGTTAEYSETGEINIQQKNNWLYQNLDYLAKQPQVLGILYYDFDQSSWECNWRILPGNTYTGYPEGLSAPSYQYITAQNLKNIIP